ncbi:MAG TPA: VOC family protein [Stackebrandtia sp.]|jgi:hypothetical protein|uniref:VOC family protein n=1 Tax=Stackebrandtia sp. TaxID=2023065 RepID=UPI002D46A960|nr:VOC family protein [Stackebrandtia sp.]HZE37499.1 VOC family protein [Stackebrandtia sp.]
MAPAPIHWKLVVDALDPHAQADFWAQALRYTAEDHSVLIGQLLEAGAVPAALVIEHDGRRAWRDAAAVRHPDDPSDATSGVGLGRRILFNRVPAAEIKTTKNRLHIDLHGPSGERDSEVKRLETLGARVIQHVTEPAGEWVVMADPEDNEFCVH